MRLFIYPLLVSFILIQGCDLKRSGNSQQTNTSQVETKKSPAEEMLSRSNQAESQMAGTQANPTPHAQASLVPQNNQAREQQKERAQLSGQINQAEQEQYKLSNQLNNLEVQINEQQMRVSQLEQEKTFQEQRLLQQQVNEKLESQQRQIDQTVIAAQLQSQLSQSEGNLQYLRTKIQHLVQLGTDTDLLRATREQYQREQAKYQQTLEALSTARIRASEPLSPDQLQANMERTQEQERIQEELKPQIQREKAKLEGLVTQYEQISKRREESQSQAGRLQQQYDELGNNLRSTG